MCPTHHTQAFICILCHFIRTRRRGISEIESFSALCYTSCISSCVINTCVVNNCFRYSRHTVDPVRCAFPRRKVFGTLIGWLLRDVPTLLYEGLVLYAWPLYVRGDEGGYIVVGVFVFASALVRSPRFLLTFMDMYTHICMYVYSMLMVCCAGNVGNLLLVLVPAIARASDLFTPTDAVRGLEYVFVGVTVIFIGVFSVADDLLTLRDSTTSSQTVTTPSPQLSKDSHTADCSPRTVNVTDSPTHAVLQACDDAYTRTDSVHDLELPLPPAKGWIVNESAADSSSLYERPTIELMRTRPPVSRQAIDHSRADVMYGHDTRGHEGTGMGNSGVRNQTLVLRASDVVLADVMVSSPRKSFIFTLKNMYL